MISSENHWKISGLEIESDILNAHKMVNTNFIVLICYAYNSLISIDSTKYKLETRNSPLIPCITAWSETVYVGSSWSEPVRDFKYSQNGKNKFYYFNILCI